MKIKRIEHIAIAVDNLSEISALLQDKFGLTLEYEEERVQTKLAMLPVGETYIELLEGVTPECGATKWIAEKGQGLYHICFEVEDIDAALAELKAKNTPLLQRASRCWATAIAASPSSTRKRPATCCSNWRRCRKRGTPGIDAGQERRRGSCLAGRPDDRVVHPAPETRVASAERHGHAAAAGAIGPGRWGRTGSIFTSTR